MYTFPFCNLKNKTKNVKKQTFVKQMLPSIIELILRCKTYYRSKNSFKLFIAIFVNWYLFKCILRRIPCYPRQINFGNVKIFVKEYIRFPTKDKKKKWQTQRQIYISQFVRLNQNWIVTDPNLNLVIFNKIQFENLCVQLDDIHIFEAK